MFLDGNLRFEPRDTWACHIKEVVLLCLTRITLAQLADVNGSILLGSFLYVSGLRGCGIARVCLAVFLNEAPAFKVGPVFGYGIPFFYRQATIIYTEGRNELWKPSFTLYSYGGAVIDYVAGSDGSQQEERLSRDRIYRYNQIPATVLGPPDLDKPDWDQDLYVKLEQLYRQAFDPMRYMLAGTDGRE